MILNDLEIRKRCLVPTHQYVSHNGTGIYRHLYTQVGEKIYSVNSGQTLAINQDRPIELKELTPEEQRGYVGPRMIEPFEPEQVRVRKKACCDTTNGQDSAIGYLEEKIISYGTSSFGYDVSLADDIRIFSNSNASIINPKKFDEKCLVRGEIRIDGEGSKYVILPPNSYLLGHTREVFNIPKDIMVVAVGKSTYARCAAIVNTTPIEPQMIGTIVIEVSNASTSPLMIFLSEGIAQFLFFRGEPCEVGYADRGGKYQGQQGLTTARV